MVDNVTLNIALNIAQKRYDEIQGCKNVHYIVYDGDKILTPDGFCEETLETIMNPRVVTMDEYLRNWFQPDNTHIYNELAYWYNTVNDLKKVIKLLK